MLADSAAMGAQYGYKLAMCAYLVPQPADLLAAFVSARAVASQPVAALRDDPCRARTNAPLEW